MDSPQDSGKSAAPLAAAERARLLQLAGSAAVATAILLVLIKGAAVWWTGSVSILASLLDSLIDSGVSLLTLLAIRVSLAPPDTLHRFGHGKAEAIAALLQSLLITASAVLLAWQALQRLLQPEPLHMPLFGLAVMALATLLTLALVGLQSQVVKRTDSMAIRADALHYRMDIYSNVAVMSALMLAMLGWPGADPVLALLAVLVILGSAWRIGKDALGALLDQELSEDKRRQILALAHAHPQVLGVHDLRTRRAGPTVFVQLHLDLSSTLSLQRAHSIGDQIRSELVQQIPGADIVIHLDPVPDSDNCPGPQPAR